jgi:hypothetical protein
MDEMRGNGGEIFVGVGRRVRADCRWNGCADCLAVLRAGMIDGPTTSPAANAGSLHGP